MAYGRFRGYTLETTDYMDVLTSQIERVAHLATRYFLETSRETKRAKAKAFLGALYVLYRLSVPALDPRAVGEENVELMRQNMRDIRRLIEGLGQGDREVELGLEYLEAIIEMLRVSELLYRVGRGLGRTTI